jgi:hypothetical protein
MQMLGFSQFFATASCLKNTTSFISDPKIINLFLYSMFSHNPSHIVVPVHGLLSVQLFTLLEIVQSDLKTVIMLARLRLVATRHFNFLPHAISILNRKISNQNTRHCGAFLPWLLKSTLVWPSWL